ncbi:MAG: TraM recognition domain-containing protein [Pseudomonadota bacterium]
MANDLILPLGRKDDGRLVGNPHPKLSRMVIGTTGSAKTTTSVMNTAQALFGHPEIAVFLNDPKDGECYAQLRGVAEKTNRNFGCIDDFGLFGFDNPERLRLNPFGSILAALKHEPAALNFAIEAVTLIFIEEAEDGRRNFVFREKPRRDLHLGIRFLAEFKPELLTPGGLCDLMSDPQSWRTAREIAASEGSPALKSRARTSLELEDSNPDDYYRHYEAAIAALAPYEAGSVLNTAGADADITHEELCHDGWFVCGVLPQVYAQRVGVHAALHQNCFQAAQFSGRGGVLRTIYDELCNSPARKAIEAITIQRSYHVATDYIAQTFEDIERQYGKQLAAILADNCPVHQYLSFSDGDAQRVSKLMGEEISRQRSMNINVERLEVSESFSTGKQPIMTPDELKNLPSNKQVLFIRGYGWLVCNKLYQNELAPTCHWLSPNPQEGGVLPPDPKIELPVHYGDAP